LDLLHGQQYSKDNDIKNFIINGPNIKLICKWLDIYFGIFEIEGFKDAFIFKEFDKPNIRFEVNKNG